MGLYENERVWIGSSEFYRSLQVLGIDVRLYELPVPFILNAEELQYYVESILADLKGKPQSEYLDYITQRCLALKRWAERGYIVHVL
jgi:hypothetical protein